MTRAVALACLGTLVVGCGDRSVLEEAREPPPRVDVRTALVGRAEIDDVVAATGAVEALTAVRVASPVAGRVTALSLRPGDRVAVGELVARVVPVETEAALHGLAMLPPSEASSAATMRIRTGEIALRAPFAASVAERLRNPGEQVAAGDALVDLIDPRAVAVRAEVPLGARERVRVGMPVDVHGAAVASHGRVAALLPALTDPALTAPVRIAIEPAMPPPPVHAPVRCAIVVARFRHALVVPRAAIVARTSASRGSVVRVVRGVARRRGVAIGLHQDDRVQILGGLHPGDVVVTEGGWGLPDGATVVVRGDGR